MIIKKCKVCGAEFITYPSRIKKGKGKYCSRKCSFKMTNIALDKNSKKYKFKKGHIINIGKKNALGTGRGRTPGIYPIDWTETLRESIRQRDGYICQECGIHEDEFTGRIKRLDIHHIDYDKDNCNPENLIALCRSCHIKTNGNREEWIKYFIN